MAPRTNQLMTAELSLVNLKNCLANLPHSLVTPLLSNTTTPVQNVIVEISPPRHAPSQQSQFQRPIFLGWTGLPARRKTTTLGAAGRDAAFSRGGYGAQALDLSLIEIDATLGRALGLVDGQRVAVAVHLEPPLVHTVNIEPLTPEDWELVELHAQFLELNLLAQVRAVPNPTFSPFGTAIIQPYPLALHLTPTTSAMVKVTSVEPPLPNTTPFAKISPDAEVIVAPKTRAHPGRGGGDAQSVASTRRSGRGSGSRKKPVERPSPLFMRGLDRSVCGDWFDWEEEEDVAKDLSVWVSADSPAGQELDGVKYVLVNVLRPVGLQMSQKDGQAPPPVVEQQEGFASKIMARLRHWDDAPTSHSAALSPAVCAALGCTGMVGGVVKLQVTPEPLSAGAVRKLKVYPFLTNAKTPERLRFGGESKAEKEEAGRRFRQIYGTAPRGTDSLLRGPLTDGLVLAPFDGLNCDKGWEGGILRLEYDGAPSVQEREPDVLPPRWVMGLDAQVAIEVQPPVPRPWWMMLESKLFDCNPTNKAPLAGVDKLLAELQTHLLHGSSTLLTGAMGSGKTSVAKHVAQVLRTRHLFTTVYLSCGTLSNEDTTTATIKETLDKVLMTAAWGARLGGQAVVVLDDLHKLCKAETELQIGNDNSRNKLISELVGGIVRQHCGRDSGVVLLATAESKAALDSVIIGGHVVSEILELKAPDREGRRKVLESIVRLDMVDDDPSHNESSTTSDTSDGPHRYSGKPGNSPITTAGYVLSADLDFLDVAALTDGYMPADLKVLISRAQKEAIFAAINEEPVSATPATAVALSSSSSSSDHITLSKHHFDLALKGFTPASLRSVSLQTSSTTFASIGGLTETRRIILETIEYPTRYAPIFARCPLRLRSGLLLYGYPGCGKTLLASAVAGECGLNFITVKGPEILNKYIGASEKTVRDLFERASAAKPCVLFFDEFDSIAPRRGHDSTGVTDRVVNQLLVQMDGAEGLSGVYVLAATSRPDLIDPALLRPGRLDKSIICDLPAFADRIDILTTLSAQMTLGDDLTVTDEPFEEIARRTDGYSGADLAALIGNAQLAAIREVLNDNDETPSGTNNQSKASTRSRTTVPPRSKERAESVVQFRYGYQEDGDSAAKKGPSPAEMVEIRAKLDALRLARKRARQARQHDGLPQQKKAQDDDDDNGKKNAAVVVRWRHIEEALRETGRSMSETERLRLKRIYTEFVTGRDGAMRDGQASEEVGGRSSLA